MRITTGAFATLLIVSVAACGSSSGGDVASSPTAPPPTMAAETVAPTTEAPAAIATTAASGGAGVWKATTRRGTVVRATVPATAADADLIGALDRCGVAMNGAPRTWVLVHVDTTDSTDAATTINGTVLESDGTFSYLDDAMKTVGKWNRDAFTSKWPSACRGVLEELSDQQARIWAGGKGIAVLATATPVYSPETVALSIGGQKSTPLTYTGS